MIYRHNSTIGIKTKPCASCGKDRPVFSRGRCQTCAKIEDAQEKMTKAIMSEDGLPELIEELDKLVSKWVRFSAVGEDGLVECYTSGGRFRPEDLDAGHYVTRSCMYLRFDLRNIRPQSRTDNRRKYGMAAEFGKRLEEEHPGITEILLEESRIIHKWSRSELQAMIDEYKIKIKGLKPLPINEQ